MAYYNEHVKSLVQRLPQKPGVYQYFNAKGTIIYIGKAKSLKKRVSSYFTKNKVYGKTRALIRQVADLKVILVDNEVDALLLENTLIKKHKPRFNVQLKDDKTYPWICIKKEWFPRIVALRKVDKRIGEFFGPYPSVRMIHLIIETIHEVYPIRKCTHKLTKNNWKDPKYKSSLEYHLGNCRGTCQGEVSPEDYDRDIQEIRSILKGNTAQIVKKLQLEMRLQAEALNFESAHQLKTKIEALKNFQAKSAVVSPTIHNVDVFSIKSDEQFTFVNYLKINSGSVVQGYTLEYKKMLGETDEELLDMAIAELRQKFDSKSKELIVPFKPTFPSPGLTYSVPLRGEKKKLLELSLRNSTYQFLEKQKQERSKKPKQAQDKVLEQIQKDFRLKELPVHMECFDNSNFHGTNAVAACVVFKNGKPAKRDYRHFNIKTVEGPDDFASMTEVVYRRYRRLLDEDQPLPQLIIIDGGKGQLGASVKALESLDLMDKVAVVGIAKKLEEIFFPGDPIPLHIDKRSPSLKVIQQLRNEAHRFGITHHRDKRSKNTFQSELDQIPGIGPKTVEDLLRHFKSVKKIESASLSELQRVISLSRAQKVKAWFEKET